MSAIPLNGYGTLEFKEDYWAVWQVPTAIGAVDLQVDAGPDLQPEVADRITAVLARISEIDASARAYLSARAPEDVARARSLREPSLLFTPDELPGSFRLFYSGEDEDDETCYGVAFQDCQPFNLMIGD